MQIGKKINCSSIAFKDIHCAWAVIKIIIHSVYYKGYLLLYFWYRNIIYILHFPTTITFAVLLCICFGKNDFSNCNKNYICIRKLDMKLLENSLCNWH